MQNDATKTPDADQLGIHCHPSCQLAAQSLLVKRGAAATAIHIQAQPVRLGARTIHLTAHLTDAESML